VQQEPSYSSIRADGQTNTMKLTVTFGSFANASKNSDHSAKGNTGNDCQDYGNIAMVLLIGILIKSDLPCTSAVFKIIGECDT
jgi:hypothetical protein